MLRAIAHCDAKGNAIEREFKFAMLEMDSRYAQIKIARDEVRLGKDEVEQARERYNEGLADNRELIDAQQRLADATKQSIAEQLILESNFAVSAQVMQEFIANALRKKSLGISESQIDATMELLGHVPVSVSMDGV